MSKIKMVALDLDGTALSSIAGMSDRTCRTLEECLANDVHVVIATGRGLHTIPAVVRNLKGIRYFITANGAKIWDDMEQEFILSLSLPPEAVRAILDLMEGSGIFFEVFVDGHAYVGQDQYDQVMRGERPYRNISYIKNTRTPVPDLFEHALEHESGIESINMVFPTIEDREAFYPRLAGIENTAITSSFHINWEMGAKDVGKGSAVHWLADQLGIAHDEIMACGDGSNDKNLLEAAGLAVAVANADEDLKSIADYITDSCEDDGVAKAVDRFVFGR